ncbi:hypothetical protein FE275_22605 [Pseudomonas koreensis]|nr:hypothetical protein FE275_22605 [Pseudomonas koreensis]
MITTSDIGGLDTYTNSCRSGLARECGVSFNINVADPPYSRASPLPQGINCVMNIKGGLVLKWFKPISGLDTWILLSRPFLRNRSREIYKKLTIRNCEPLIPWLLMKPKLSFNNSNAIFFQYK